MSSKEPLTASLQDIGLVQNLLCIRLSSSGEWVSDFTNRPRVGDKFSLGAGKK